MAQMKKSNPALAKAAKKNIKFLKETTKKPAPKPPIKKSIIETTRVGGVFSVPKKPKKTIY